MFPRENPWAGRPCYGISIVGGSLTYTLSDTVKTVWGANDLFVSFGGRGNGFTTATGDSYLDNFQVLTGQLDAVPEPATATLLLTGLGSLMLKRRRAVERGCAAGFAEA